MFTTLSKTILFIPGSFLANNCWDEWKSHFETKGFTTTAVPWPHKYSSPEALRNNDIQNTIASVRLTGLLEYFTTIIHSLPETPILIGHSVGGLIVQLLLQRGLGSAGAAIHSFPPRGAGRISLSFIKEWWEPLGFFSPAGENYLISFKKWKQSITNGMDCEGQKQLYYLYAVPESKRLIRDLFIGKTRIDFNKPHAPLLLLSGGKDRLIPSSVNYRNYRRYTSSHSITSYMEFPDHNHLIFGSPEWKEEADHILYWLQRIDR
jgi:pimeloyl-ACP methyl ester carboxylesterase